MNKHKRLGFTVIELMIVIVVIAVLATITTLSYREVQKNARDEKRKTDAVMLRSAAEEYYSDNGEYPRASTCTECWRNEVWDVLKSSSYLNKVPQPDTKSTRNTSYNVAADGNANYMWNRGASNSYAIYVPMESGDCKLSKGNTSGWWGGVGECNF